MLSSITPLGERGRHNRWALTVVAYIVGSTVGGSALGTALGACGSLLPRSPPGALGVLATAAVVGVLVEFGVAGAHVPTNHRQVNERWLDDYRGWVYGAGYGLQLGLGVVTIVTSATTYLAYLAALLCHSALGGLAIGAVFGLARSLPVLLAARVRHPAALRSLLGRNERWAPLARRIAVAGQLCAVAVAFFAMMVAS
jgi:hypothetical protein